MLLTFLPDEQTEGSGAAVDTSEDVDELPLPNPLDWAYLCRRIDDKPFSLDYRPDVDPTHGYEPLKAIYADPHPHIAIMKPAQVGVSELAITIALHTLSIGARYWKTNDAGLNVGYLFPTQTALSDFSKERVSAIKEETDDFSEFFTGFDDVGFKKAGKSYFYLRGAWTTRGLKSFKADKLILDEYDEMLPLAVSLAKKRLRHSKLKHELDLSTPTFPNKGIHELLLQSDYREWEIRCTKCGQWSTLDFFRDVYVDGQPRDVWKEREAEQLHNARLTVCCPTCIAPLSDMNRFGPGRWVARSPEIQSLRGYHVPWFAFPSVSLLDICKNSVSTDPTVIQENFRSDLGMPYEPRDSSITDEMLKQLSVAIPAGVMEVGPWRDTTMGVDGGARYYVRITSVGPDGHVYVRHMGFLAPLPGQTINQQLAELMTRYRVRQAVIDGAYDPTAIKEFAAAHKGKVRRAFYPTTDFNGELFRLPSAEEKKMHGVAVKTADPQKVEDIINVNRTMAMDSVFNLIALAKERWPAKFHNDPEIAAQMKAPIRVIVKDKEGKELPKWIHSKPDDFFHSCVYDVIARATLPRTLPGALGLGAVKVQTF